MARTVRGGVPHEPAVEADPVALGAMSGEGEVEAPGAVVAPVASPSAWRGMKTVETLLEMGYVGEHEIKDFRCVLGRSAVRATQECMGTECMAWRVGPVAEDAPDKVYGYCGLAGRP